MRTGRLALWAAAAATVGVLVADALALRHGGAAPTATQAWLLGLGSAGCAIAVGWALWRQRQLDATLREARAQSRALVELCDAWTWEADAAQRVTRWLPPSAARVQASDLGQAVGRTPWEIFGADAAAATALRQRLEAGLPLRAQRVAMDTADGARRHFELDAVPLGADAGGRAQRWLGTARALDDYEALVHAQRLLDALLAGLPLPVFELSGDVTGPARVARAGAAAAQWLGVKPAELDGMEVSALLTRLPQELRATLTQALAEPSGAAGVPPCPGWDVRLRPVAADATGRHQWLLALMPLARVEAAPAAATADSESFSYTVSHDLRAPIRVVEGFTKIVKEDYGRQLDRIGNDHLDRVLGAAARMNSMIDALLALAQLSSRPLSRQPVNLSQLAAYVVEDLRRQAPERTVAVHVEAGLLAQGDPTLLRVVLENLLGNAWKYSARSRNAQIWLERGRHAGHDVFTVRDNGAGFDMRFADRLFGVFQRLHSASDFPGTGIGLATVRRIIARHGGEIWAESVVDRGSSFHFTVPATERAA